MTSTLSTPPPPTVTVWPGDAMHDSDEDGDEINTANARVFFGALKSPELKFAHLHTPKACHPRTTYKSVSPAGDIQPDADLISFDALGPASTTAPHPDNDDSHADLFEATTILDAPPLKPSILSTPSRVPLPPSPLTAEDKEVEQLLTPHRAAITRDAQSLDALEHKEISLLSDVAPLSTTESDRALHATSASLNASSALNEEGQGVTLGPAPSTSQEQMSPMPPRETTPRTPTLASLEESTRPTSTQLERPCSPQAQAERESSPALNISVSFSPTRLHTPKRKHADAFRTASPDPAEVRKKHFGAQRVVPAAHEAPRKPGPSKSTGNGRKPVQRAQMLGSLSPESDGMLGRLLAPSGGSNANINLNINIDFSRLPSLGVGAAELAKENVTLTTAASSSRPVSPKRVPVSVIFRSPSPPRRILVPPHLKSSPPKSATTQPFGPMPTRAPPFLTGATVSKPDEHPQSSPVKPSRVLSSPPGAAPSMLRQPTMRTVSKLPKPKPYAPPSSKLPAPSVSSIPKPMGLAFRSSKGLGVTRVVPSPPHASVPAQSSPAPPQGPIMIRQVIPGMLSGKTIPAKDVAAQRLRSNYTGIGSLSPTRERIIASKAVDKAPIPIRQVIPGTLRHYEGRPATPPPAPAPVSVETASPPRDTEPAPTVMPPRVSSISLAPSFNFLSGVEAAAATPLASSSRVLPMPEDSPSPSPVPHIVPVKSTDLQASDQTAHGRRSGRLHSKPATTEVRRTKPESRVKAIPDDLRTQARKLQALTTANTTHNDGWQVALIETRIVRKAGPRPPSPSSKLRGESEIRREDANRERERRARRRAGEDVEDDNNAKMKHLKGPGDETVYETPDNIRVRGRYVRWDPGLVSTPQRRGADEQLAPPRSCLATPAPNKTGMPLPSEREKVVVTKFVYDDDEEASESLPSSELEESAPSKAKGRKKKTSP